MIYYRLTNKETKEQIICTICGLANYYDELYLYDIEEIKEEGDF